MRTEVMRGRLTGLLVFVILSSAVWAQDTPAPCGDVLTWDYQPSPKLGWFYVYVSAQSGTYPTVPKHPVKSRPTKIVPLETLTVSASDSGLTMRGRVVCADLKLRGPGPWYAVVTSVALDMSEETGWDNELIFLDMTAMPVPKPPPVPVVPRPKPPVELPPPLAPAVRPTVPRPDATMSGMSRGGGLTDTDVWRGIGATPPPPLRRDVPGAP